MSWCASFLDSKGPLRSASHVPAPPKASAGRGTEHFLPRFKKALKAAAFLLLACLAVALAYRALSWKDTMGEHLSSVQQLYATPRDTVDVAFIGSSHVYAAVNPDILWRDFGIAGFDMAISGQGAEPSYHYAVELCKTQSPQVLCVDLLGTTFEEALPGNVYRNMLSMRSGLNQWRMVFADPNTAGDRASYLLKWPIVHTRYRELSPYDFLQDPYSLYGRGYCYRFTAEEVKHEPGIEDLSEAVPISDRNRRWLEDLRGLAERKKAALLFTILPHEMKPEEKRIYNGVLAYAGEQGLRVIDFNHMVAELDLSYHRDFMDPGHLNYFGGEKLTRWLGSFLAEEYGLADHRGEPGYGLWDQSLYYMERLLLREELAAVEAPEALCDRIAGEEGLIALVSYRGGSEEVPPDFRRALASLGVRDLDRPEASGILAGPAPGQACAVVEGGALSAFLSPGAAPYDRDLEGGQLLRIASEDGALCLTLGREEVLRELAESDRGLGIAVYDPVTRSLLAERVF